MLIVNQIDKIKKLSGLSYFDKNTLSQFIELSDNSLYSNINRWLKKGMLLQFKKGLYVTADFVKSQRGISAYPEFIANKLREPSYLSMEYVLQKQNILSEAVYGFTSVTLKSKRHYKNSLGVFVYRNIKEKLFNGYEIKQVDGYTIKTATRAKALFDYFYYKLFRISHVDNALVESFRLNYGELSKTDLDEFAWYCALTQTKKMLKLSGIVRKIK